MPNLFGKQPDKVVELLKHRKDNNYVAGTCNDGARLGLIVEGGAMRGTISCGSLYALYQLGFEKCFDEVWGNSAGALNAAYFVSGQIEIATTIYYENAVSPKFINILNWPDPVAFDWLMEDCIASGKPLDVQALMQSGTDLFIATTDVETGESKFFSNRDRRPEIILPALQASCSMPLYVTKAVRIDESYYNDGLVRSGIPTAEAAKNCTHVVAALTQGFGYRKKKNRLMELVESFVLRRCSRQYMHSYRRRHSTYNESLAALMCGSSPAHTLILAPGPTDRIVKSWENKPYLLKQAERDALQRVVSIFNVTS